VRAARAVRRRSLLSGRPLHLDGAPPDDDDYERSEQAAEDGVERHFTGLASNPRHFEELSYDHQEVNAQQQGCEHRPPHRVQTNWIRELNLADRGDVEAHALQKRGCPYFGFLVDRVTKCIVRVV
jgi:hypothetical protein